MESLTHSRMQSAKDCLRRHYLQYEVCGVGLKPIRQSEPLRFGATIHKGLDLLARGTSTTCLCQEIRAQYAELPPWCTTDEDFIEWQVECEKAIRMLLGYAWYWQESPYNVVATEQTFEIPLLNPSTGKPSINWALKGRMDKIVAEETARLMLMEHKTTSDSLDPDSKYWKRLRIDSQISLYLLAARRSGYPVEGVIYDVIHKPQTKPRSPTYQMLKGDKEAMLKDGMYYGEQFDLATINQAMEAKRETVDMYGARLTADICRNPQEFYVRREIPRLDSDLLELERELWGIQKRLTFCKANAYWDRNTMACERPYLCEMRDICYGGFEVSETQIPPGYMLKSRQHEELEEDNHGQSATTPATPTETADSQA